MPDRRPNRRSSIYRGHDGWWHGWVTIGTKDDGSPDRRHRMGRTEAEVTRKVQDLERSRETGQLAGTAKGLTVAQWIEPGSRPSRLAVSAAPPWKAPTHRRSATG
jgi:hypothetical protein